MTLNGNDDEINGYNSVAKLGESGNINLLKAMMPPIGVIMPWCKTYGTADSGITDGTTTDKLVDSTQNFSATTNVTMIIHNTTDSTWAYITAVDGNTTLSISSDVMATGEDYTIYKTPNLPDGYVECSGQTLSDASSPYNGEVIPDLNATIQFSGTATAGGNDTLTDSGSGWTPDEYIGYEVEITSGTGSGQTAVVESNSTEVITIEGSWATNPDATSVYKIITPPRFLRGNITSGTTGGESSHELTTAEMPSHYHSYTKVGTMSNNFGLGSKAGATSSSTSNTGSAGSGDFHENRPPFYDIVWIMRVK